LAAFSPHAAYAATAKTPAFEISGWIPYWRSATGTADVLPHLSTLTEINPFVFTVKADGTLNDAGKLKQEPWLSFVAAAKAKKVRVIPTIMWSNGSAIDAILRDPKKRLKHINAIAQMVKSGGYDGIDIDYEGKLAETRPYFSKFLKELYSAMGNKWVQCTIEARTPPDSLYQTIPDDIEYANDFPSINKYCDRVRFMTYDQESADLKLNASSTGPYSPIADPKWVEKAIRLAMKDINKNKIEIGVATYGYEYDVTAYADSYSYDLLWAFNPGYAWQIANVYGVSPARNAAGELSLSYVPVSGKVVPSDATTTPVQTTDKDQVAAAATALVTANNTHTTFRMLWWSDAQAIADKIALAKKLGVRGISIFKLDGGEDQKLWDVLAAAKK
jgi:spore germination protein YaaH